MVKQHDELLGSIAYCGLICKLCFLADKCDGCKTVNNTCERNCSEQGCYQKKCFENKKIEGCWQCEDIYSCENGIYELGKYSKIKAFAICMKEDGKEYFITRIIENIKKGLSVEKGKDYDYKTISEVLGMIRNIN